MRIFVIHPSHFLTDHRAHGDGLVAHGFIAELARRGHALEVAAEAVDLATPLPANVRIHPLGSARGPVARVRYALRMRRLYRRLAREQPFDLAHQFNPVVAGLSLGLVGLDIPVVLGTYVGVWPARGRSGAAAIVSRCVASIRFVVEDLQRRAASALLVTTPAAARRFGTNRDVARKTVELGNGVDVVALVPAPPHGARIVALCGLSQKKGAWDLVDAFARIATARPEARLAIGGAVDADDVACVLRSHPELRDRISFEGSIDRRRLGDFLAGARAFAIPSHGEPYGMAALEAMACGLPIVATRAGGLRYLVREHSVGGRPGNQLIAAHDRDGLARALLRYLDDPVEAERVGRDNREVAVTMHSWPRIIDRLEQVYATIVAPSAFEGREMTT